MDRPGVPEGDASQEGSLTGEGIRTGSYMMAPGAETFWCESNPSYTSHTEFDDNDEDDSTST